MEPNEFCTAEMIPLINRLREGDVVARDELLQRIWCRVARMCRRMLRSFPVVRSHDDTGDVMHPALLRLLNSLQEVRPESSRAFFGLVAEQVRRTLIDLARYYRSRKNAGEGNVIVTLDVEGRIELPDHADHDLPIWEMLHETAEKLPSMEREVFALTFYNGSTQREIADLLGMSERQVRRYWLSACMKLRDKLGPEIPGVE